ncbi:hypothetical protein H2200_006397 [Cladophialophora chaetospira]|uniref:Uncharacterized protein n=1 Tax=Cladophialophora chaetospira TaxID=386627 RepID=A0AA38X845_9EURO|nr:hypothetical protein H2200_006397 [Cladophialophora chaetospira]
MSFFHHKQENEEKTPRRHSLRDLEAKAYAKWVSQGVARKSSNVSGFEAERARRHFWAEETARSALVMKY